MIAQFEKNERVCFIGDSITHNGTMCAAIFDVYAKRFPERGVVFYNCGIGGATLRTGLAVLHDDALAYEPTSAVVMYGMNDIGYVLYDGSTDEEKVREREKRLSDYFERYRIMVERLLAENIRVILCSPTPYDEGQRCEAVNRVGSAAALRICRDFVLSLAEKYGLGFVDLNTMMTELVLSLEAPDPAFSVIGPDRIHPTQNGQFAMARFFLREQGIDVDAPTPLSVHDGSVRFDISEKVLAWRETEAKLRDLMAAEYLVLGLDNGRSVPERIEYIKNFISEESGKRPYYIEISKKYLENKPNEAVLLRRVIRQAYEVYR